MFNLFKKNPKSNFKFQERENTACFACDHVIEKQRPILFVTHDSEGQWSFLCGQNDHSVENAKLISLKNATNIDQSVNDLFEMPINVGAERQSVDDKWIPFRLEEEN